MNNYGNPSIADLLNLNYCIKLAVAFVYYLSNQLNGSGQDKRADLMNRGGVKKGDTIQVL